MISIRRERWVITRNDTEVFCGLARHYQFKPISDIGDTAVKTYLSESKAIAAFNSSWAYESYDGVKFKAVKVTESIEG